MISLRIRPIGNERLERALALLAHKVEHPQEALKNIGEALLKNTRDRFETQTGPDGLAWAPLAPLTVFLRGGAKGPILCRADKRLFRSTNYALSGRTVSVGANAPPYDRALQFGVTITPKKGNALAIPLPGSKIKSKAKGSAPAPQRKLLVKSVTIPARPYIGFGPKDEAAVLREIEAALENK